LSSRAEVESGRGAETGKARGMSGVAAGGRIACSEQVGREERASIQFLFFRAAPIKRLAVEFERPISSAPRECRLEGVIIMGGPCFTRKKSKEKPSKAGRKGGKDQDACLLQNKAGLL
jgi:hypothetical protein